MQYVAKKQWLMAMTKVLQNEEPMVYNDWQELECTKWGTKGVQWQGLEGTKWGTKIGYWQWPEKKVYKMNLQTY